LNNVLIGGKDGKFCNIVEIFAKENSTNEGK